MHKLSQEITYKLLKVFISSYSSIGNKSTEGSITKISIMFTHNIAHCSQYNKYRNPSHP